MKQYIDKSALAAEIEKKIRTEQGYSSEDAECGYRDCAREILSFINTLEVKEVDFETEWKKYFEYKGNLATVNVKDLAKHFFDLGLKAQKGE